VRVALLAASVWLAGCGLWYRPVPIRSAIGKERTAVAGDSFSVHRDPRFEVYGPGTQPVFDAYEQLKRTYRSYDRYFGGATPRLAVVLYPELGKPRESAEQELRARGLVVLRFVRPLRASFRERVGDDGYEGSLWPVGPAASRLLLASFAAPNAPHDSTALARLPVWYRSAVMTIIGDGSSFAYDIQFAKESRTPRGVLEEILFANRPTTADSLLEPRRRDDASDSDRRLSSLSSAFMQFLLEREGPAVMSTLARGFADGETVARMATRFRTPAASQAELEERWLAWLAAQRPVWQ